MKRKLNKKKNVHCLLKYFYMKLLYNVTGLILVAFPNIFFIKKKHIYIVCLCFD